MAHNKFRVGVCFVLMAMSGVPGWSWQASKLEAGPTPYTRIEARKRGGGAEGTPRGENVANLDELRRIQNQVERVVEKVNPAVVALQIGEATGSGVVVSADGYIMTVAHVCVKPGRDVRVMFADGKIARAKTLGTNHEMDSALVKITEGTRWPYAEIGPSRPPTPGAWTVALGHPGGFDPKRPTVVRTGRVHRIGDDFFQTDCTITAGDSGGPLFDLDGRVIGIHSRISDSTAENYHVPVSTFVETWVRLKDGETWGGEPERTASRPWLGTRAVDDPDGCVLERVEESGPAGRAGLKVGDVILKVNGEAIGDSSTYSRVVRRSQVGQVLEILIRRASQEQTIRVKVEERKSRGP